MPRIPRKFVFDPAEVRVYHCINRCVRRAFLCGFDPVTGKCYDHRKDWIQQRLEFLAGQFAVDVLGFSIMSNHIHLVVRNRPDVTAGWSDDEIARRCRNIFPQRKDDQGRPAEPTDSELSMITANPEKLAQMCSRLSDLSWFIDLRFNQQIAAGGEQPAVHQPRRDARVIRSLFRGVEPNSKGVPGCNLVRMLPPPSEAI